MKNLKSKGKALLDRITGISCPIGGVSWTPPVDEQAKARRLLVCLADRRVLFNLFELEVGPYVVESIVDIRKRLTDDLQDVPADSLLSDSLQAMRAACRKFMDQTQELRRLHVPYGMDSLIHRSLGELRGVCGLHIAKLACAYDLEIEPELAAALPAEMDL
jgi:hypothetical protein